MNADWYKVTTIAHSWANALVRRALGILSKPVDNIPYRKNTLLMPIIMLIGLSNCIPID